MYRPCLFVCFVLSIFAISKNGIADEEKSKIDTSQEKGEIDVSEEVNDEKKAQEENGGEEKSLGKVSESKTHGEEKEDSDKNEEANTKRHSADIQESDAEMSQEPERNEPPDTKNRDEVHERDSIYVRKLERPSKKAKSEVRERVIENSKRDTSGTQRKSINIGVGVPLYGFAYEGVIEGKGWANTSTDFVWGNIDLRFQFRLSEKFSVGGGLLQSFIKVKDFGVMGGHIVADFIWYAIPDYLYFKMDLFFGFPMFFALGPSMGHSFSVNKKVYIYIENQFLFMAVAGVYGFWQPTVGVSTRF